MAQNFDGGNIDEFLSIRQHFPHQNFSLMICRLPARPLKVFAQGIIASIRAHANFPYRIAGYFP